MQRSNLARVLVGMLLTVVTASSNAQNLTEASAQAIEKQKRPAKARLSMSGTAVPELACFDDEMAKLMSEHEIPGAAIAVTNHGRLIFARGYGFADKHTAETVEPTSLFRIASISKSITAIAVMQLVEQQRLTLDTKVYPLLGLGPEKVANGESFDDRCLQITVEHLLEHRGGFDRDASFDLMFRSVEFAKQLGIPAPAMPWDIIHAMQSQPLDFTPGERYAYSNYGYCLLGRVIERVSGMSYEAFVKQHVLAPLGTTDMRIGGTRKQDRAKGEVKYYATGHATSVFQVDIGEKTPWPYGGWCLEAMDSHGGWIASAVDLAKIAAALDDPAHCKLLSQQSLTRMHQRPDSPELSKNDKPADPVYYSLGWQNRVLNQGRMNHWHNGSLDGTSSILIRRHDGKNFVVLLNTRTSKTSASLVTEIDALPHRAAALVERWPTEDQFSAYGL